MQQIVLPSLSHLLTWLREFLFDSRESKSRWFETNILSLFTFKFIGGLLLIIVHLVQLLHLVAKRETVNGYTNTL